MKLVSDKTLDAIHEKVSQLKKADITTELLPHQQRIQEKLKNQRGLVLGWEPGQGKSLGSIAAQDALKMPATYVTPAALKSNMEKEYKKHVQNGQDYNIESIENLARKGKLQKQNPLVVIDEAHRLRNPSSASTQAAKKLNAEKLLLLTGTPTTNHPVDIAPLVNMASGENLLPENKSDFERKYIYDKKINPSFLDRLKGIKPGNVQVLNKYKADELKGILNKWVDYVPASKEGFPDVEEQEIKVPMSHRQLAIYDTLMNKAPPWVAAKVKAGLPPSKQESQGLNSYLQGARQAANTNAPFINHGEASSPKIQKAFEELQNILNADPSNKGVVVSNYLDAGLNPYSKLLDEAKIPYGMFTGEKTQQERSQMVNDYNEGKLRALLLSPSGSEGIDLKKSTMMQLLEPNWNMPRSLQAQARAIRYGSHEGMSPEKQKVIVQRYLSTRPAQGISERLGFSHPGKAVDEYLVGLAQRKEELNKQLAALFNNENELPQKVATIKEDVNKFIETKNYNFLLQKLPSKGFQNSLIKQTDDPKLKNFVTNVGSHLTAKKKHIGQHHSVHSETKPRDYIVIKHPSGKYTCDCPNYIYVQSTIGGECKHISKLKGQKLEKIAEANIPFCYQTKKFACGPEYIEKNAAANVPLHQQETQQTCSAACLKMVLKKYGIDKTEKELSKLIGVGKNGAEGDKIRDAARKLGFEAEWKEFSLEEAIELLKKDVPIIMDSKSWNYPGKFHWVVLEDIDLEKNKAEIADPNTKGNKRFISLRELDEKWSTKHMYSGKNLTRAGVVIFPKLHARFVSYR